MDASSVPPGSSLVLREQLPLPRLYAAPRTPTETVLAEIWRSVLSMDCVGIDDSYVDLGGDSFHAEMIFQMIEETFAISVPVAALDSAPTVAGLAARIDQLLQAGGD
jgi:acyl carrier protein